MSSFWLSLTQEFSTALNFFLQIHLPVSIQGYVQKYCGHIGMFSWNPNTALWGKFQHRIISGIVLPMNHTQSFHSSNILFWTVFFPGIWDPKCFSEFPLRKCLFLKQSISQQKYALNNPVQLVYSWAAAPMLEGQADEDSGRAGITPWSETRM